MSIPLFYLLILVAISAVLLPLTRTALYMLAYRVWRAVAFLSLLGLIEECFSRVWNKMGHAFAIGGFICFLVGDIALWSGYLLWHGHIIDALCDVLTALIAWQIFATTGQALQMHKAIRRMIRDNVQDESPLLNNDVVPEASAPARTALQAYFDKTKDEDNEYIRKWLNNEPSKEP
ncbi:MAG TPA: hypothetical protein VGM92_10385 [Candidatus Kapabacteria bacterium]